MNDESLFSSGMVVCWWWLDISWSPLVPNQSLITGLVFVEYNLLAGLRITYFSR